MILTESIRSLTKKTTYVISVYTVLLVFCSYAHERVDLFYSLTAFIPILLLFCMAPLVAVFFLSTQYARRCAVSLLGIMPAELIYIVITRFTSSPIKILHKLPLFFWKILYEGSFGFVLILNAIGFWLTLKLLREIYKQMAINKAPAN